MSRDSGFAIRDSVAEALARAKAPCITSSFQAECVVLTHLLLQSAPDIPVLFLDTVHHFAETYTYRDEISDRWKLNLINLRAAEPQPGLWRESTSAIAAVAAASFGSRIPDPGSPLMRATPRAPSERLPPLRHPTLHAGPTVPAVRRR